VAVCVLKKQMTALQITFPEKRHFLLCAACGMGEGLEELLRSDYGTDGPAAANAYENMKTAVANEYDNMKTAVEQPNSDFRSGSYCGARIVNQE
jgi:hypothetical protein